MRWVRANLKFESWCALFALAVQLTVSFGHVHSSDLGLKSGAPRISASSNESPIAGNIGRAPSEQDVPDVDYCAICAVINLAGSVAPPVPPAVPAPVFITRIVTWTSADTPLLARPQRYAQARAPPHA
jgi:hypothetical protein